MKHFILLAILFLLLFLAGCTEMTREEKNTCYYLASRSYDFIPNCETEDSCYAKINPIFQTELGHEQETRLYELKNDFARSWFFYNKSIKSIEKIKKHCQSGNAPQLPGEINETKLYLEKALIEMENGIEKIVQITIREKEILEKEKIDLIKEEEIYNSLNEIQKIIGDLETGETNGNNYINFYFKKIENYNKSQAKTTGLLIEKDSFPIQTYSFITNKIESKVEKTELPILSKYISLLFPHFENQFYISESLSELKKLPTKEFMTLYSNIAGNNNSLLSQFSDLMNKTSKNLSKINKKIPLYWEENNKLEKDCLNLNKQLGDKKEIKIIEETLLTGQIKAKQDIEEMLLETLKEKRTLEQESFRKKGEELFKLKQINNSLKLIKNLIEEKIKTENDLMIQKCNNRAEEIIKKEETEKELNNLLFEAQYFAKLTKKEANLLFCTKMLEKESEYLEGKEDFEKLKAKKISLTANCFEEVEKILEVYTDEELKLRFEKLKKEKVTEKNIFLFNDACTSIKNQLEKEILEEEKIQNIIKSFERIEEIKQEVKNNCFDSEEKEIKKFLEEIEEFFYENKKYYYEEAKIQAIIIDKDELYKKIDEKKNYFEKKFFEIIKKFIQKNFTQELISHNILTNNTKNKLNLNLIIKNPFETITGITINLDLENAEIIESNENIDWINYSKSGAIYLKTLKKGTTTLFFQIEKEIKTSESEKIIYITNKESLIQKEIQIQSEAKINKILLNTNLQKNLLSAEVLIDGKENFFSKENNEIQFVLENANKDTQILINQYLKNLIDLEMNLKEIKTISLDKKQIIYEITAKNNYPEKIKATLVLPLNIKEQIEKLNIFDSQKTNKHKELVNSEVILKNQEFQIKETKKYEMIIETSDLFEYYSKRIQETKKELIQIGEENIAKKLEQMLGVELNTSTIKEIEELLKQGNSKIENYTLKIKKEYSERMLEEEIEREIKNLETMKDKAEELFLENISKKIETKLMDIKNLENKEKLAEIQKLDFDVDKEIETQTKNIIKKIEEEKENNYELNLIKEKINSKASEIQKELFNNPVSAHKKFKELLTISKEFDNELEKFQQKKEKEQEIQKKESKKLIEENKKHLSFLEKEIEEIKKNGTIDFIFPISTKRIEQIKKNLEKISGTNTKENLEKLNEINTELKLAISEIKKEVIKEYNLAIDSGKDKITLSEAKKAIDKNDFVSALFILKNQGISWTLSLIPIILIIIVSGAIKINYSKKRKAKEENKKKLFEIWED
jgi:hypothetical protein